jgi:transcriptional regulator with XRE-family HTH domain
MAARKKTGRKKATRKKSAEPGKRGRKKTKSASKTASKARAKRAPARRKPASLGDRLTELVEHAAAGLLRRAVDVGGEGLAALLPETNEMRREAGAYVRELRELAGMTLEELSHAVEISDRSTLEAVEAGTSTLSFELTLRLAAILARHDPLPFISRLVRTYNPVLWQLLEDWGIGELPLQLEREREFVNLLRRGVRPRARLHASRVRAGPRLRQALSRPGTSSACPPEECLPRTAGARGLRGKRIRSSLLLPLERRLRAGNPRRW